MLIWQIGKIELKQFDYWNKLRAKSIQKYQESLKRKPIKKVSTKQAKKLKEYSKAKAEFFEEVTHCQFPGCEVETVTCHHMRGRIGGLLTDKEYFKALCWVHHQWVEENPEEAKAMGLSLDRLNN